MKMFVETDPDSRLAKRMYKETEELGRNLDQVRFYFYVIVLTILYSCIGMGYY